MGDPAAEQRDNDTKPEPISGGEIESSGHKDWLANEGAAIYRQS